MTEPTIRKTYKLSPDTDRRIRALRAVTGHNMSQVVTSAVEAYQGTLNESQRALVDGMMESKETSP